ncbi:MAG TPA: hypothetical protein VFQ45_13005 [Longimicrobium sp.]|nr:hypothetical protein [Longimicrobium sp.]
MTRRLVFVLPVLLAACTNSSFPDPPVEGGTVVGITGLYENRETTEALQAPESARVGETFTVRAYSYGSSSCTDPERVDVDRKVRQVEIVPYDRIAPQGTVCTMDLHAFPREIEVRFDVAGEAVVRLRGRSVYGGTAVTERRVTIY